MKNIHYEFAHEQCQYGLLFKNPCVTRLLIIG